MPNRIIKESIAGSERIAALSDFEFRLWVGLITFVDDKGRGDARPVLLRSYLFPLREDITTPQVAEALDSLARQGCIKFYQVEGKPYFYFPNWDKHQRVRNIREKYPAPPSAATCGESRPESESESVSESESENETESESESEHEAEVESELPDGVCADAHLPHAARDDGVDFVQTEVVQDRTWTAQERYAPLPTSAPGAWLEQRNPWQCLHDERQRRKKDASSKLFPRRASEAIAVPNAPVRVPGGLGRERHGGRGAPRQSPIAFTPSESLVSFCSHRKKLAPQGETLSVGIKKAFSD